MDAIPMLSHYAFGTPSDADVREVAKQTVAILRGYGLSCCFVGSVASVLWGASRTPNDVDVVVMSTAYEQEELKRRIVARDSTYYLVPSKNWRNTYKVLWKRIPGRLSISCKVDILVPPVMNIPFVDASRIVWSSKIPIMPLFAHLLLKLQAWQDHRDATFRRPDLRAKRYVDVKDIGELLVIAVRENVTLNGERWLPKTFLGAAERRVMLYITEYPASRVAWEKLGFK